MKKKILVIEDNEDILEGIRLILTGEGYDVQATMNSQEAQQLTKEYKPDLIILDLLLSGGDGSKICSNIKDSDELQHIPIVMMSAHPLAEEITKESRADGFISKPFDISVLIEETQKHIGTV